MSKRKTKIIINNFYIAYGGPAHPAFIYFKTNYGTYLAIKTGTTGGKDYLEIKPTQKGIKRSFINKRPFEGTRKDFGEKILDGLSFNILDWETIELVKKKKSRPTKSAKKAKKIPSSQ